MTDTQTPQKITTQVVNKQPRELRFFSRFGDGIFAFSIIENFPKHTRVTPYLAIRAVGVDFGEGWDLTKPDGTQYHILISNSGKHQCDCEGARYMRQRKLLPGEKPKWCRHVAALLTLKTNKKI